MKKPIFNYLNFILPNSYRRETYFGMITICDGKEINIGRIIKEVEKFFGKDDRQTIVDIVDDWVYSLPILKPIVNSTNHDVLIHKI